MNFEQTTNILSLEITELLRKKMRFIATMQQIFGVLMAISGGLACIGIITAIFGVPILLAGIKLFQSGSALNLAADFKKGDDLAKALEGLHGYWKFTLIGIILLIVFYIILFAVIIAMIPSYSSYY